MKLRDYQQTAVEAVLKSWQTNRSCLIVLPTGCGKTVVFGEVIRRRLMGNQPANQRDCGASGGRHLPTTNSPLPSTNYQLPSTNSPLPTTNSPLPTTNSPLPTTNSTSHAMILAHREELVAQAEEKVAAITASSVDVEMGPRQIPEMFGKLMLPSVVVSSVQTQITGRMKKFMPGEFSTLVIDEAHHATSKSYRACIEHYLANPDCRLLGVTATPDRADETALGIVFESVAYEYSVDQAIKDGWLVPVRQKLVTVGSLDLSQVSTTAGDFNAGELGEILEEERNLHGIASPTIEICGERRAIVFATTVRQAERLAEIINRHAEEVGEEVEKRGGGGQRNLTSGASLNGGRGATALPLDGGRAGSPLPAAAGQQKGSGRAAWICGKTPKDERKSILEKFRAGEIQFIVNVGVLTEGFDDAGVEVVVMARPTKSRALYAQMAGRATRPAAEIAGLLGEVGEMGEEVKKSGEGEQWNLASGAASPLNGGHAGRVTLPAGQQNENRDHHCPPPPTFSTSAAARRRELIARSSKPSCLIVDFVGNSGRHKLVSAIDILGGKELDPDEEAAKAIVRRKCEESGAEGLDTQEELAKAREEVKRRKADDAKRRAFIKITAKYSVVSVDPFNVYDLPPITASERSALDRRSPTIKQRRLCRELIGVDPDRLAYSEVKGLIDAHFGRRERGLATLRQTKFLRRKGVMMPMSFEEASATIGRLMAGGKVVGC